MLVNTCFFYLPTCLGAYSLFDLFQDLSRLGRDLSKVVIVDNSPASYIFHPDNAVSKQSYKFIRVYCQLVAFGWHGPRLI